MSWSILEILLYQVIEFPCIFFFKQLGSIWCYGCNTTESISIKENLIFPPIFTALKKNILFIFGCAESWLLLVDFLSLQGLLFIALRHVESSCPRDWTHVTALAGGFLTPGPPRKPIILPVLNSAAVYILVHVTFLSVLARGYIFIREIPGSPDICTYEYVLPNCLPKSSTNLYLSSSI